MASDVRFADIRRILASHGWTLARQPNGSHFVFAKPGEEKHISLPVHKGRVKAFYIKQITKTHGIDFGK